MRTAFSNFTTFVNQRSGSERLTVVVRRPVTEVQIDLERDGDRASVILSADEVGRLNGMLDALLSRGRPRGMDPSETFHGDDGETLVVTRTNWGEPFEEGLRFSLTGETQFAVDMPGSELFYMRRTLGGVAKEFETAAEPGRSPR